MLETRAKPEMMRELILQLCSIRAWNSDEIAMLLHRNSRHLRDSYLTPMTAEGLLERTYPEIPSHPHQAYRAARQESNTN
jgi:ATP-dependent DNA helicase RecG